MSEAGRRPEDVPDFEGFDVADDRRRVDERAWRDARNDGGLSRRPGRMTSRVSTNAWDAIRAAFPIAAISASSFTRRAFITASLTSTSLAFGANFRSSSAALYVSSGGLTPIRRWPLSSALKAFTRSARVRNTWRARPDFFAASSSRADVTISTRSSGVQNTPQPSKIPSVRPETYMNERSTCGSVEFENTSRSTPSSMCL